MKRRTYVLYLQLALLILVACSKKEKETDKSVSSSDNRITVSKTQFESSNMKLGAVEAMAFPISISVNGMIDVPPEYRAYINSTMGGFIKTTHLIEGDEVKKGQALVTIENPEFVKMQQEYLETKGQLGYLKAEYDRQKTMRDEHITSEKNYLKAESNYNASLAKFNGLQKQLNMLNISPQQVENGNLTSIISLYSPINGSVTKINVSRGSYVSPAESIMEIIDNSHIHLELSFFEKDILNIKRGQKILFKIPEISDETFDAEVHLVGKAIENNRTITVHGHPKDTTHNFLTGMFINAQIILNTKESFVLPESAIVNIDNENYILVLDDMDDNYYYFNQINAALGDTVNGYTELNEISIKKVTDSILIDGAFSLIGL